MTIPQQSPDAEERRRLARERRKHEQSTWEQSEVSRTDQLRKLGEKYPTVIMPERRATGDSDDDCEDANWKLGQIYVAWYLKPAARADVWRQIEEARKLRREAWLAWLPIISAITGLVGTATGLAALLLKK